MEAKPKNYLVESILVTIFCCLIFGIIEIVNAAKVNSLYDSGDHEGALKASNEAKKWAMWGLIAGLIVLVLYIFLYFVMGVALLGSGSGGF